MSSDEGEGAPGFKKEYGVHKLPWRAESVTRNLRTLDALRRRFGGDEGQGEQRGAKVRPRFLTSTESTRTRGVPRLPRTAYNPEWLQSRNALQRQDLQMRDVDYDFSYDADVDA